VARREPKRVKALEVSVMFEPNRFASISLSQVYERVLPTIIRRVASSVCRIAACRQLEDKQRVGGRS